MGGWRRKVICLLYSLSLVVYWELFCVEFVSPDEEPIVFETAIMQLFCSTYGKSRPAGSKAVPQSFIDSYLILSFWKAGRNKISPKIF